VSGRLHKRIKAAVSGEGAASRNIVTESKDIGRTWLREAGRDINVYVLSFFDGVKILIRKLIM
jgi:hypothetical protein